MLALVLALAAMWRSLTYEFSAEVRRHSKARRRRKVITDAVSALIAV